MAKKETSAEVSKIAGDYVNVTAQELRGQLIRDPDGTVAKIRKIAASATGQDETAGG